jgi:hypothetical protein
MKVDMAVLTQQGDSFGFWEIKTIDLGLEPRFMSFAQIETAARARLMQMFKDEDGVAGSCLMYIHSEETD